MAAVSEYAGQDELRTRIAELEAQVAQLQEENQRLKTSPSKLPRAQKR